MKESEIVLLNLLSDSLFSTSHSYSDNIDWNAVLDEAQKQAVEGLIAESLPVSIRSEEQQIQREVRYWQYICSEEDLINILTEESIPVVVLKGSSVAVYYSKPSLRSFGDIDIIVPLSEYERTKALLKDNGYIRQYEEIEDRHSDFIRDVIPIELHHRFSFDDVDIEQFIVDGLKHPDIGRIDDHTFPMLPALANGMVLLAHMRHHLQIGLGLRQVIDWMMYCDKVLDDDFWNSKFQSVCETTGMTTLAVTVTAMCQKYIGLKKTITWCSQANEALCDELMQSLLSSGNFGIKHGKGINVEKVITSFRSIGVFKRLQKAGKANWRVYKNHQWLVPFCWFYQIIRYIKQGARVKQCSIILDDFERGNQRFKLLKKLNIQ